jgi:branched-subunit amino acid transport protein
MLKLSMKCWNSAFEPQGSRLIIVVVQLGALKIYVAAVEALKRKERQDETQFTTKVDGFLSFIPPWMLTYVFSQVVLKSHPVYDQTQGLVLCFSLLYG